MILYEIQKIGFFKMKSTYMCKFMVKWYEKVLNVQVSILLMLSKYMIVLRKNEKFTSKFRSCASNNVTTT